MTEIAALIGDASGHEHRLSVVDKRFAAKIHEVAVFGHSWAFLCHSATAPNSFIKSWGVAHATQARLGGDVVFPQELNYGIAGDTTAGMLGRCDAAIADMQSKGCSTVLIPGLATNDRSASLSVADSARNSVAIIKKFIDADFTVVVLSEAPRNGAYELTGQNLTNHTAFYEWGRNYLPSCCVFVDIWDTLSSGGIPKPGMLHDGIHLSQIGADAVGKVIAAAIRDYVPLGGKLTRLFDALVAVDACSVKNPSMEGTSGTIPGNCYPSVGSVLATHWNGLGQNAAGLTTHWYKEVEDGVTYQVVRITGNTAAGANPVIQIYQDVDLNTLVSGDKVVGRAYLDYEGQHIVGVSREQYVPASPAYYALVDGDYHDASQTLPSDKNIVARITPVYTHNVNGSTTIVLRQTLKIVLDKAKTVDVVVRVAELSAFKV